MKAFYSNSSVVGYGSRIFVPYEHTHEARKVLDKLSCWGGADKDTGKAKGWEFGSETFGSDTNAFGNACQAIQDAGFTLSDINTHSGNEVYP